MQTAVNWREIYQILSSWDLQTKNKLHHQARPTQHIPTPLIKASYLGMANLLGLSFLLVYLRTKLIKVCRVEILSHKVIVTKVIKNGNTL